MPKKGQFLSADAARASAERRFSARYATVTESGCWLWLGSNIGFGYGEFYYDGRSRYAHRFSWQMHRGAIPPGMFVCHKCDTPSCVNPAHLFLGTGLENVQDKMKKGRSRTGVTRGEKNPMSKLSEAQVRAIRAAVGRTQVSLGAEYGVSHCLIGQIRRNQAWRHL